MFPNTLRKVLFPHCRDQPQLRHPHLHPLRSHALDQQQPLPQALPPLMQQPQLGVPADTVRVGLLAGSRDQTGNPRGNVDCRDLQPTIFFGRSAIAP